MVILTHPRIDRKQAFCAFSRIRCIAVFFALALLTVGCANTPGPRGFYANALTPGHTAKLAEDSARQMTALFPPASTYLSLKQPAQDAFGVALVGLLRGKGYAVSEVPAARKGQDKAAVMATVGSDFGYVVDMVGVDQCRVTLTVGNGAISRIYSVSNNGLAAIGYWVRRA